MKLKKRQYGLSLIEVLISLSITITITGLLTSFLSSFNKTSIINTKRSELSSELRRVNLRLQKEIESCSKVLAGSNADTLRLSRPVLNRTTYMRASDNPNDLTKNDLIVITFVRNSTSSVAQGKLLFSLTPASNVTSSFYQSPTITNQALSTNISNSSDDNTYTPTTPFTYYKSDDKNNPLSTGLDKTSLVKIDLFGKKEYGETYVRENLSTKITIRNYIN